MPGKKNFDAQLAALEELRQQPVETWTAPLRAALKHQNNYIVAKAADMVTQHQIADLLPDLLTAFDRFFEDAEKRDPQCWAKKSLSRALATLAERFADVEFLYPVHLNPSVQEPVKRILSGRANVHLAPPCPYPEFVWLMDRSTLIVSDSGGVQEEAPSLRKPVLLMRDTTERPEAVEGGAVEDDLDGARLRPGQHRHHQGGLLVVLVAGEARRPRPVQQVPVHGLVAEGLATTENVDVALRDGLALRWSFMGPFETIDLNAPTGVRDYAERYQQIYAQIFPSTQWRAAWLGPMMDRIEAERRARVPADLLGERAAWRDRRLMALAAHKRRASEEIGD